MRDSWLGLVESVLRPARPHLRRCLREREIHLESRRAFAEQRARALAHCEVRIQMARAAVFAADDGVVTLRMTELEREWRRLSRADRDAGLMDLWSRIAPPEWMDRKLWRDSAPAGQLDAAVLLAADVDGVERAEAAARALRSALAAWGVSMGAQIRWRAFDHDVDATTELLTEPLRAACEDIASFDGAPVVLERAQGLEREVHTAMTARFPQRPMLARSIAHAAFVDFVQRAATRAAPSNPVAALVELWRTGYSIVTLGPAGITLGIP